MGVVNDVANYGEAYTALKTDDGKFKGAKSALL